MKTKTKTRVPATPIFDFELNKHTNLRQRTTGFREKNKISYSTDTLCMKRKKKETMIRDQLLIHTTPTPTQRQLSIFFELPHLNS